MTQNIENTKNSIYNRKKEKNMNNLYSLENEVEELKKIIWNLTRNTIPALEKRITELENKN